MKWINAVDLALNLSILCVILGVPIYRDGGLFHTPLYRKVYYSPVACWDGEFMGYNEHGQMIYKCVFGSDVDSRSRNVGPEGGSGMNGPRVVVWDNTTSPLVDNVCPDPLYDQWVVDG